MIAASASATVGIFRRAATIDDALFATPRRGGGGGTRSPYSVWTAAELETLASTYAKGGYKAAAQVLPGRSKVAIFRAAERLGIKRRRRWTSDDDRELRELWSQGLSLRTIAHRLKRTQLTTHWRSRKLGLTAGAPVDFEHLSTAAKRAGYSPDQLRQILAWAGVPVRRALSRPTKSRSGRRFSIVEIVEADDAVARWLATEPVEVAARRAGVTGDRLRRLLRRAGLIPAASKTRHHVRVTDDQVRAVLGAAR